MTIHVTQEDIDKGEKCSAIRCPIAAAVGRATGDDTACVSQNHIVWADDGSCTSIPTPKEALAFLNAFDDGQPVQPFTFELEAGK